MKDQSEIQPEVKIRLTTVGRNTGIALPQWFVNLWGLEKGDEYVIRIEKTKDSQIMRLFHFYPSYQIKQA
jgi:hypothetical protein